MRHSWRIWVAFALALAVMFGVMGWTTATLLRLDRAQWEAQRRAAREEDIRLALWRMEAAVTPLIAQETARPYFAYLAFYPVGRSYGEMFAPVQPGEPLAASELLSRPPPRTLLHFQVTEEGKPTSPQVPPESLRARAVARHTTAERIKAAARRLEELGKVIQPKLLLVRLPEQPSLPLDALEPIAALSNPNVGRSRAARRDLHGQKQMNQDEQEARVYNTVQAQYFQNVPVRRGDVREGVIRPLWSGQTLLLARRVRVKGQTVIQGCWLDWPALKKWLLAGTGDLLPQADLKPVRRPGPTTQPQGAPKGTSVYQLAALPVILEPNLGPIKPPERASALSLSLRTAWACLLLATAAVAALLLGALSLGRRRAAFVSAVTHELRTPLTTFRMYAEMLADDMVQDPTQRREYLHTLLVESNRLRHLVENVLTYARLEARGTRQHLQVLPLRQLLEGVTNRLKERTRADGMELVVEAQADIRGRLVRADPWAVEMILFNLVDNACKYAAGAEDRRIHLAAERRRGSIVLRVRDHGPGIGSERARRLFRPFRRSRPTAAELPKGVGLGLAISRRLARNMGGNLEIEPTDGEGACFALTLPVSESG